MRWRQPNPPNPPLRADRRGDRQDRRGLRTRHRDQHQRRGQAGGRHPFHALAGRRLRRDRLSRALHGGVDRGGVSPQGPVPDAHPADAARHRRRISRSTTSASAIPRCRRSPTSPPTRSRSTGPSSPRSTSGRAARACSRRSNCCRARHERHRRGRRDLRGTRLSRGGDPDPSRAGLLFRPADVLRRNSARPFRPLRIAPDRGRPRDGRGAQSADPPPWRADGRGL